MFSLGKIKACFKILNHKTESNLALVNFSVKNESAYTIDFYVCTIKKEPVDLTAEQLVQQLYHHSFIVIRTRLWYYLFTKVASGLEVYRFER